MVALSARADCIGEKLRRISSAVDGENLGARHKPGLIGSGARIYIFDYSRADVDADRADERNDGFFSELSASTSFGMPL